MTSRFLPALALALALPLAAHAGVSVSIDIAPPILPVYVQPVIPSPGYIWTPGYWRWSPVDADYYWVPGTWIAPPFVGALWTPGYWGWGGGGYLWHGGYWGNHIGFYGGINYGFGYVGHGYQGGYWNGGVFNYNRSVNNINTTIVHNVYNTTVVNNNTHVSFNGGQGGVAAQPTREERLARSEPHVAPTPVQRQHETVAMHTPAQRMSVNHGAPSLVATARPADLRGEQAMQHGQPQHAQPPMQHAQAQAQMPQGQPQQQEPHGQPQPHAQAQPQHPGGPAHAEPRGEHQGGNNGRERER
jgi:hypothetical protein